jgi:hypothetical protein
MFGHLDAFQTPVTCHNGGAMNNSLASLSIKDLKRAVALKEKIARLNKELAAIVGSGEASPADKPAKKRKMSAAGRAAIRRAAKARWAKWKAEGKK